MTVHEPIAVPDHQRPWRLRVKDFTLLEENGAFVDHVRAELLDGEVWVVNAVHSRHASVQADLQGLLWSALRALRSPLRTYVTPTVEVADRSRVEPDLAVAEPNQVKLLPIEKIRLAVEVSDTTLDRDLGPKRRIYAAANVPEYWVADVNGCIVYRMWSPVGDDYESSDEIAFGAPMVAATIDGLTLDTSTL